MSTEVVGRALARLASRIGGQLMLELPDDLDPKFVASLLIGANLEVPSETPFALFVRAQRKDIGSIFPAHDFRELAMFRQGSRLAVTFASENSGMATYSSVYPLLLSNGFPVSRESGGDAGVATLRDFADALSEVLEVQNGSRGLASDAFRSAMHEILVFLAMSYEEVGNGQTSFETDWWLHVGDFVESLSLPLAAVDQVGSRYPYACAGLPAPLGESLTMSPKEYVAVLRARWSDPTLIMGEIGRLHSIPSAKQAAAHLASIDWEAAHAATMLKTDSLLARVAIAVGVDRRARVQGWSLLTEDDFKDSFVDAKGKLRILRDGADLPSPWKGASPLLLIDANEVDGSVPVGFRLENIGLVVPFRPEADPESLPNDLVALAAKIRIEGASDCVVRFESTLVETSHDGLRLVGSLEMIPATRTVSVLVLNVTCSGEAATALVDRCSATSTLIRSDEAALWVRPSARGVRSSKRGPYIWSSTRTEPIEFELPAQGKYEFACAWGSEAGLGTSTLMIGSTQVSDPWPGMEDVGARAVLDVSDPIDVTNSGQALYRIDIARATNQPLSAIVAASRGVQPDTKSVLPDGTLQYLEQVLGECVSSLGAGDALGSMLAMDTNEREDFKTLLPGVYVAGELASREADLSPRLPSQALKDNALYRNLLAAYKALGLPELIERLEEDGDTAALTVSRLPLDRIQRESIDALLVAYGDLLSELDELSTSDRFWARHPFSAVVFPDQVGIQSAHAVLLSPLHPIRLAWSWSVQVGLRGAADDGVTPAASLSLLDGTQFPAFTLLDGEFGNISALLPIPTDAHPSDVYLGWHASVAIVDGRPTIPHWIAGRRFPVDGLSALSSASVGSAIDDFMRVSPHVQALKLGLAAAAPARRSAAIDDGILAKVRGLAQSSTSLDGVAGVQIRDSTNRLGSIPNFAGLEDAMATARQGFNVEWTSTDPSERPASHVTFLEGSAAKVRIDHESVDPVGWLPQLPLRRTPRRVRRGQYVMLDYNLSEEEVAGNQLGLVIRAYEASVERSSFVLKVIPNLAGITGEPNWLVAADFGVDPQSLADAAALRAHQDYILWDWRPATAVRPNGDAGGRVQPYFVLAVIPRALNSAIRDRIRLLNAQVDEKETGRRTSLLVSTLAQRAIGLNTLLSIGHHQATGALGFFFALRSLKTWIESGTEVDMRLVIPVDAVDPFLRVSASDSMDGSRRRADLLAVRAEIEPGKSARVVITPIEIKHYGLSSAETAGTFPLGGETRLEEHVGQLLDYQRQVIALCDKYRDAAGGEASVLGQRIAALVDAAIQLSPGTNANGNALLSMIVSGLAQVEVGKGILLWYQAGASGLDGSKCEWDEVSGTLESRRIDVKVDPIAFDSTFWGDDDGACHVVMREALQCATSVGGEAIGSADVYTPGAPSEPSMPHETDSLVTDESTMSGLIEDVPVDSPHGESSSVPPEAALEGTTDNEIDATDTSTQARTASSASRVRLSASELERRYKSVLSALGEFNVKVDRPQMQDAYREGPGFIEFAVHPAYGVPVSRVESQIENLKLRLKLPADAIIGCSTHLGNVLLTVPKSDEERYYVDAEEMWSRWSPPASGFRIPLGEDISGSVVTLDLASSSSPHILIAGVTGSGKSEALLTMLHGAARFNPPSDLQLLLVDPKQTELTTLAELPHTRGDIGWTGEDAVAVLEESVDEMEARYATFKSAGSAVRSIAEFRATGGEMARWLVVLDEYADLVSDEDDRAKIERSIKRLAQKARAAGIHIILSTQKPVVTVVNTVVKGNLPGRVALRVNSATESRVVLDEAGAEELVGKGDAIVKSGNVKQRVQFARFAM